MNKDDRRALKEFTLGALPVAITFLIFFLFILTLPDQPLAKEPTKVIDTFENCRIIRWEDSSGRYHYFADCSKK